MDKPIQPKLVTIISGFLGAGKTTFLNAWIAHRKHIRPFIIENEFGKEGIDGELIMSSHANIFELNDGCLCCNLNEEFYDLLVILWDKREEFDELIIETTGIADPASIAEPFMSIPQMDLYYRLDRVICLVDAQLIETELAETQEARKQIAFSDVILINKSDMIHRDYLPELVELLSGINPFATILTGNKEDGYPISKILTLSRDDFDARSVIMPPLNGMPETEAVPTYRNQKYNHHDITSLSFISKEPFDLEKLENSLLAFLRLQPKDIYRLKGFINVSGNHKKIIIQSVSDLFTITEGSNWDEGTERVSRIVIIGKNLQSKVFEKMLLGCLLKDYPKN